MNAACCSFSLHGPWARPNTIRGADQHQDAPACLPQPVPVFPSGVQCWRSRQITPGRPAVVAAFCLLQGCSGWGCAGYRERWAWGSTKRVSGLSDHRGLGGLAASGWPLASVRCMACRVGLGLGLGNSFLEHVVKGLRFWMPAVHHTASLHHLHVAGSYHCNRISRHTPANVSSSSS